METGPKDDATGTGMGTGARPGGRITVAPLPVPEAGAGTAAPGTAVPGTWTTREITAGAGGRPCTGVARTGTVGAVAGMVDATGWV
ncbi:MAG: hypothetical protein QOE72_4205 [Chloroflexota bacterium]|jgi:hypothetical protein|nr:hypothetical protein [Chloroflexota bacterium]